MDPLAGALACLPAPERALINPWMFIWRTLSAAVSCHLQEVLKPLPRAAILAVRGPIVRIRTQAC